MHNCIKKIFDAHEAELKSKTESIRKFGEAYAELDEDLKDAINSKVRYKAELNELKNRTCEGCEFFDKTECYMHEADFLNVAYKPDNFSCNNWVKK